MLKVTLGVLAPLQHLCRKLASWPAEGLGVICPNRRLPHGKRRHLRPWMQNSGLQRWSRRQIRIASRRATRMLQGAIRRPRGMTNCLCGRSEDPDSIAAVVPAVILLHKGDWEDLFDKSEVSPLFLNTIYSQYRSRFPPKYHEKYQFIFKPA